MQYNDITTDTGTLQLNFSQRLGIVNLFTVYNLSIIDSQGRYVDMNVNYSVNSPNETTIMPLNLQRLMVIVTNYDAERVCNVTVDLYSDGVAIMQ